MKRALTLMAVVCLVAMAADNVAATRQSIDNRQSAIVNGVDAIAIPQMLSYQGKLTDTFGLPVADTLYAVRFRLYAQPTGGTQFWEENQNVKTAGGLFSTLLGSVTPITSVPDAGAAYLGMAVAGGAEMTPRLRIASAAYAYLTARAANADLLQGRDTTTFSRSTHNHDAVYVNEAQANSVTSTMITDATVAAADLNQMGASSGQVMKWTGSAWAPRNDSVGAGGMADNAWVRGTPDSVLYTAHRLGIARGEASNMLYGGFRQSHTNLGVSCTTGTSGLDNANIVVAGGFGNRARAALASVGGGTLNVSGGLGAVIAGGAGNVAGDAASDTSATVAGGYGNVATAMFATVGGGKYDTASGTSATVAGGEGNRASGFEATVGGGWNNVASGQDATVGGGYSNDASGSFAFVGGGNNGAASGSFAVVAGGSDNGAAGRGGFVGGGIGNTAGDATADTGAVVAGGYGNRATGKYSFVGGGRNDTASGDWSTVGGGSHNGATGVASTVSGGSSNDADTNYATVSGGGANNATGYAATVGGGSTNTASGEDATVGGGSTNTASGTSATVCGGFSNQTTGGYATIGGGSGNIASGARATVGGGINNRAESDYATVSGGYQSAALGTYSTVAGGYLDTSAAASSFTTNSSSVVPSSFSNAAAFNGQRATASNQTRVGALSKASGTFTIDHPTDPSGKILNHYFIEGPEMLNIYRGSVVLDAAGRAEVRLPDYFDALNRNPMVQLTGVGTHEVHVSEDVSANRFAIGGRPGTKVYWQVTGERRDVSAEITRRLMPVEQLKTGVLAGTMLDDDFLRGAMDQLVREGKAQGIDFRTATGRAKYEKMRQLVGER